MRHVVGRVLECTEEELLESQSCFRVGRGCADMTFTVCHLLEKSYELCLCSSTERHTILSPGLYWVALQRLGIPENVISLIR